MDSDIKQGRIWLLLDKAGKILEDIDTDQIYHNAHLHITDVAQMGPFALGNLEGWQDFPKRCEAGDIVIAGRNFGAGSSRQQAVDCFVALKVGAVIAPSFSAIYFRNAVNSGFPILKIRGLEPLVASGKIASGDVIRFDVRTGEGENLSRKIPLELEAMNSVQYDIFKAGNLFKFGRSVKS
jgi:3-isopropylmalate/(R)-2-methylmalate dehydratase small subunit